MSISRDMKKARVYEVAGGYDEYNRPLVDPINYESEPYIEIEMTINRVTQSSKNYNAENELRYSVITHIGLTTERGLKKGQRVVQEEIAYTIEQIPNTRGRLTQVYLREVGEDGR